jgi:hypothetical protein
MELVSGKILLRSGSNSMSPAVSIRSEAPKIVGKALPRLLQIAATQTVIGVTFLVHLALLPAATALIAIILLAIKYEVCAIVCLAWEKYSTKRDRCY